MQYFTGCMNVFLLESTEVHAKRTYRELKYLKHMRHERLAGAGREQLASVGITYHQPTCSSCGVNVLDVAVLFVVR